MTVAAPLSARPLRTALVLATAAAAALTAGCARRDRTVAVTTRLDCPSEQGALRRTAQAADGRSCAYAGPDGEQVTLAYLALDGFTPQQALRPTEAQLRADVPQTPASPATPVAAQAAAGASAGDADPDDDDRAPSPPTPPPPPAAPGALVAPRAPEPPQVDRAWSTSVHGIGTGDERVRINLPFLHIDADGSGRAHVRTFGVDVEAGDDGAVVSTPGGGVVDAGRNGAEMRFGSVGRRRADLMYLVAASNPGPQGWRSAGYIAKGPASGPLVVATLLSRGETRGRDGGDLHDVRRLVNANLRGGRGFSFDID